MKSNFLSICLLSIFAVTTVIGCNSTARRHGQSIQQMSLPSGTEKNRQNAEGVQKFTVDEYAEQQQPRNRNAEIYLQMGIEYMRRGQNEVALEKLKLALEADSNFADVYGVLAVLHERLGEKEQAKQYYEKALNLNATSSDIHNNYGQFLCSQGNWEQAEKHFLTAVENPLYKAAYIPYTNAAICAFSQKNNDKGETYLRKALQVKPDFPVALYQMARLSYDTGQYKTAQEYLERYLKIDGHTPQTLWLGVRIERALGNREAEANYALMLRSKFPDAEQVQLLNKFENLSRQGQIKLE